MILENTLIYDFILLINQINYYIILKVFRSTLTSKQVLKLILNINKQDKFSTFNKFLNLERLYFLIFYKRRFILNLIFNKLNKLVYFLDRIY